MDDPTDEGGIGITGTSPGGELSHLPYVDPEGCARTIIENPDLAFGVKLRFGPGLVPEYSAEPVKLARRAAEMAGGGPMSGTDEQTRSSGSGKRGERCRGTTLRWPASMSRSALLRKSEALHGKAANCE